MTDHRNYAQDNDDYQTMQHSQIYDRYRLELHRIIIQNKLPERLIDEIHNIIEEHFEQLTDKSIETYEGIIVEVGSPREFLRDFLENRHLLDGDEYEVKLEGDEEDLGDFDFIKKNFKRLIQIFLLLLSVGIFRTVFLIPFMWLESPEFGAPGLTVYQVIEKFGPAWMNPFGLLLLVSYFLILVISTIQLLYANFDDHITLYMKYFLYLIILGCIIVCMQFVYINEIYRIYEESNQEWMYVSGWAWNTLQWQLISLYGWQMALLLLGVYYRTKTGEIYPREYRDLGRISYRTAATEVYDKYLYWINTILILGLYIPLYIDSAIEYFRANGEIFFTSRLIYLMLTDLTITILIGFQMLLFAGIVINWINTKGYEDMSEISLRNKMKYHMLYFLYIFSTFIPDNYLFNTDGAIIITSLFAIFFLGVMWVIQLVWIDGNQLVVEKKMPQYFESKKS